MSATFDGVIRGATVVDGSGRPGRTADVGIRAGRIGAIGRIEERGGWEIEADGLVIAPGIVDIHTHYDAQLFWDGAATPSSFHGVTTVIGGNCGFSIAPLVADQAPYLAAMLARVEGIPLESLEQGVPWDWSTFGEFLDRLDGVIAVNAGFLAGHTTLRRCVMGVADDRPATNAELEQIERLLRASLTGGALGFSSSLASSHNDAAGRPVSSRFADRDEFLRLAAVTGEYEGTTLEFIPTIDAYFSGDDMDLMTAMSVAADRPLNWNILNVNTLLWDGSRQRLGAGDHAAARGGRVVALTMPISSTLRVNFISGFVLDTFADWTDLFALPPGERRRAWPTPSGGLACGPASSKATRRWCAVSAIGARLLSASRSRRPRRPTRDARSATSPPAWARTRSTCFSTSSSQTTFARSSSSPRSATTRRAGDCEARCGRTTAPLSAGPTRGPTST